MLIITSTVSTEVYIQILNNFLIPSIENMFDDEDVFFKITVHLLTAKRVKGFLQERR